MKKAPRLSYGGASNRKVSLGTPMAQARVIPPVKATPDIRTVKKNDRKDVRPAASHSGEHSHFQLTRKMKNRRHWNSGLNFVLGS